MARRALGIVVLVLLACLASGGGQAAASAPALARSDPPEVGALAVAVVDGDSGALLYGHNAHERRAQASLTKMTTAMVAVQHASLTTPIRATENSMTEPAVIGMEPGDVLNLKDALYGLLLNSGNDAALAIAETLGQGSIDRFVGWMNESVARLGLQDTHFENPHGFDAEGHYSSAYDAAMIGRSLLADAFLRRVVSTQRHVVAGQPEWVFKNINPLLGHYPGADGIKTGYETNAGRCLASSATRNGHRIIVVVLHDDGYVADSGDLLDWAFEEYSWSQVQVPAWTVLSSGAASGRGASADSTDRLVKTTVVARHGEEAFVRGMARLERLSAA